MLEIRKMGEKLTRPRCHAVFDRHHRHPKTKNKKKNRG